MVNNANKYSYTIFTLKMLNLCQQLKGSINLALCLGVDEVVLTKQGYQFSLSTPDRVFHFSSDSKQLIQATFLGQNTEA